MDILTENALYSDLNFQKDFGIFGFGTLYRMRYDEHFDDTDPLQFGYIQDEKCIKPLRFNKAEEQVLYTATNPSVAYLETIKENQDTFFYLSLWSYIPLNCDIKPYKIYTTVNIIKGSNAENYYGYINKAYNQNISNIYNAQIVGGALELAPSLT